MLTASLLIGAAFLCPQDAETLKDFKKYFRRVKETFERVEYVHALEDIDDPGVAKLLLPVLTDKDPQVATAALIVIRQLPSEQSRLPLFEVAEKGRPTGALPLVLRAAGEGGWEEFVPLIRPHLEHSDHEVRLWAATSLGQLQDVESLDALGLLVQEDPHPLVRVAAVDALGAAGVGHEVVAGPPLVAALDDEALEVQTAACLALARVRTKEAIEPLIRIMETGEGRILEHPYPTLIEITDLEFNDSPQMWRRWWDREKDRYEIPTAAEIATRRQARAAANAQYRPSRAEASFLGVDTPSRRVVFVVDVSGSMEEMITNREAFRERGFTRFEKLEIVKEELLRSIEGLESYVQFNVISFASQVHPWRKGLVSANALNRRSASDFVRKLKPIGGSVAQARAQAGLKGSANVEDGRTNTYAALLAGMGIDPEKPPAPTTGSANTIRSEVDTVFFLSDGRPSVGELSDPDDIADAITDLNRFRRITLHTIAIGEFQKDFMMELARDNGGVFVDLGG